MSDATKEKKSGFFARMISEDPSASSQRFVGLLSFIVAIVFAALANPTFKAFLMFCGLMFGIKEGRKGFDAVAAALGKKKEGAPAVKAPTDTKPVDNPT